MNRIQDFLKRHFYLVNLGLIGVCSSIGGLVLSNLLQSYLITEPPKKVEGDRSKVRHKKPTEKTLHKSRFLVAQRNIFCSSCEPVEEVEETEIAVASMLDAQLLVTLISDDPDWSMAAVKLQDPTRVLMVKVGQKIRDAEITKVETRRLEMMRDGKLEYLELFGDGGKPELPQPETAARPPHPKPPHQDDSIRQVGPNRYEVDRKLVDEFLQNAAMTGDGAKIMPNMKDGRPDGFRLMAIRPNSIFSRLGIRNGDVINAINNQDITSPDKALELYTKLRGASHLTISLTRHNKPLTMTYTIR